MTTLNATYADKIVPTPPGRARFLAAHWNVLGASMKLQGLALHNAVVDLDFTLQPNTREALQQVDRDLLVQMSGSATEAEVWTRTNALWPLLLNHFNDAKFAHTYADATSANLMVSVAATSTGTASTRLLEMKTAYNLHRLNEVGHNDLGPVQLTITNTPVDAATNLDTLNEMLYHLERHLLSAFVETKGRWY